jgi:hypothetical protein
MGGLSGGGKAIGPGDRLIFFDYADPMKRVEDRVFEPGDWLVVLRVAEDGRFHCRATDARGRILRRPADLAARDEVLPLTYLPRLTTRLTAPRAQRASARRPWRVQSRPRAIRGRDTN